MSGGRGVGRGGGGWGVGGTLSSYFMHYYFLI